MKQNLFNRSPLGRNSSVLLTAMRLSVGLLGFSASSAVADEHLEILHSDPHTMAAMEEKGISPYAIFLGEIFNNHSGGIANGSAWAGLLDVGVEFDLEKLVGWDGATFFVNAFYFHGDDASGDLVGDFNLVSNIYNDTSFNFYNIFLQQSFGSGDSFFKIGQIALDDDFMVSESALLFLNAGFGPLPVQSGNTAAPIYGLAAPGAVINYAPSEQWFFQGGIYNGDSGQAVSNNQGFDWRTGGGSGFMLIAEMGYQYGEENGCVAKFGGFYHSGETTRFSDGGTEEGLFTFYGLIDHQLVGGEGGSRVNVFLRGGMTPDDDVATVTAYVDAGVVVSNAFTDDDAIGLAVSWTDLSDGGAAGGRTSEIVTELTYQIPVTNWCVLQPDLQYIINPQGGGENALLTGLRAEISF